MRCTSVGLRVSEISHLLRATLFLILITTLIPHFIVEATHFQLYKRAKHVFSEALRVLDFRKIALDAHSHSHSQSQSDSNSAAATTDVHIRLGKLLDESHASCRDQFQCSCTELDELTSIAKKAGAWGSRLTGAYFFPLSLSPYPPNPCQSMGMCSLMPGDKL